MKTISILIPTIRLESIQKCMKYIYLSTSDDIDYEILVVSPLNIKDELPKKRLNFIQEDKKQGIYNAVEIGWKQAEGKYIFVIADDQLLQTDCIKNLINKMSQHDNILYLTGARSSNLWEPEPDQYIYSFYYPCNSCIKKDDIKTLKNLYDPYYSKFLGDPDLALRVLNSGGIVEPCLNAWLINDNVKDKQTSKDFNNYWQLDYDKFFKRWHHVYGKGFELNPSKVNIGSLIESEEIPMEFCFRVVQFIKKEKWLNLYELIRDENVMVFDDSIGNLFGYILINLEKIPQLYKAKNIIIQKTLLNWILNVMLKMKSRLYVLDFNNVFIRGENLTVEQIRNLLFSSYFIYIMNKHKKIKPDFPLIQNYQGINIIYNGIKFVDTKTNSSDKLYKVIMEINKENTSIKEIDYLEFRLLENLFHNIESYKKDSLKEYLYSVIDYFCNKNVEKSRIGHDVGNMWWRN